MLSLCFLPGDTPLYKSYGYLPPQRVLIFADVLVLKKGEDSAHFGLESGMVFESIKPRECMKVFIVSVPKKEKERELCEFEVDVKKIFLLAF